jgi:CspA family cold shock protein
MNNDNTNRATVKFYNASKGFGFLVDSETGTEIFTHVSGIIDDIKENDMVTYSITEGKRGPNAVNVKLAR